MTCASDLFTALLAIRDTDIATGGLYNPTSAAYVPIFVRKDDPNSRGDAKPRIEVEVVEDEKKRYSKDNIEVLVRFHLYTDLMGRFGSGERNQDAVLNRMRQRAVPTFNRRVPTAQTLWSFTEMGITGVVQMPTNLATNELHAVVNARLGAREV